MKYDLGYYMKIENKMHSIKGYFRSYKNFSIWRLIAYFIIYSILGFIIETIFGLMTKGVIESRKSFLYGPFCAIYGVGAVIMIVSLTPFKDNNNRLFLGGFIVGSIVEYIVSLIGEIIFHVKWWDYSSMPLNINGRICVYFSIFWGLLGIYLISYINPKIDRLINYIKGKLSSKYIKPMEVTITIFLLFDFLITMYALKNFYIRTVVEQNIDVENKTTIVKEYERVYGNEKKSEFLNKFFGNEKMIKTFPNLKLLDSNGEIIYFDSFFQDIKPYYYKINNI